MGLNIGLTGIEFEEWATQAKLLSESGLNTIDVSITEMIKILVNDSGLSHYFSVAER